MFAFRIGIKRGGRYDGELIMEGSRTSVISGYAGLPILRNFMGDLRKYECSRFFDISTNSVCILSFVFRSTSQYFCGLKIHKKHTEKHSLKQCFFCTIITLIES